MIQRGTQHPRGVRAPASDEGFTLLEVIWALFLMGLVAMVSLMLFLNGMSTVSDLQRQQGAVTLAATALDQARAVTGTPVDGTGTSGLIKGRSLSAVQAAWDAADPADVADMNIDYDAAPALDEDDQWVPIRSSYTVDNQDYTVDTLIGTCWRLKTSPNVDQPCTRARGSVDDAEMYRVRVVVSWDTGTADDEKTYRVSTLVDPSEDVTWNTALLPFAYDDEFTVVAGEPESFHAILLNDAIEIAENAPNPMNGPTTPSHGSYAKGTGAENTGIWFEPPPDTSGTVTFTYGLRDAAGQFSPTAATVMVHILPKPASDGLGVPPGVTTELNDLLLDNDTGVTNLASDRATTIVPFIDPTVDYFSTEDVTPEVLAARDSDIAALAARGITVDGDGNVNFAAPGELGVSTSFSYYLVDAGDGTHYPNIGNPATVTVITEEPAPDVADEDYALDATASETWHDLDWRTATGNDENIRIRVTGVSGGSPSHVRVDGGAAVDTLGDTLEFRTRSDNLGIYEIEYELETAAGTVSEPATLTVTVAPVAADTTATVARSRNWWWTTTTEIDLVPLGVPSAGVRVTDLGEPTCGSAEIRPNGRVRFTSPTSRGTCTFTYELESTANPDIDSHDVGNVVITVTN